MFIPFGLFLFTFFFYLRTHCASFNINDSGETIMVCDLLTISHSPGYPLHTLWGRVCCLLPLGQPMFRVTFCSMLTGALSIVVVYWILEMMLKSVFKPLDQVSGTTEDSGPGPWLWKVPALCGALIFAFSYQHWFQACGAKGGIYTLNTFLTVGMLFLFYKMRENGWFVKSLFLMAFFYGLGLAHHWPNQLVMAPAYLWFLYAGQKKFTLLEFLKKFLSLAAVGGFALGLIIGFLLFQEFFMAILIGIVGMVLVLIAQVFGFLAWVRSVTCGLLALSIYLYLPIRSVQDPLVNWWNPRNLDRLVGTVLRKGYQGIGDKRSWTTIVRNLNRFWLHAHHQFGDAFTYFAFLLAAAGFYWLWKKQKTSVIGISILGSGVFFGIIFFNNPLEGYQWTIDNFFSPVFLMVAFFAAAGMAWICEWVASEWPLRQVPLYASAFCLSFALMPLILNYPASDQSRYVSSYDEGMNMLKTVNRDAVILCNGDIDILPLWYLQFVEGKRQEVVSFTMQLIPYDWYREPLFKRWPFLYVPVGQDVRPETVVQNMIEQ
ncbi:MAG TPA: DUF2723 domain-containing protein, partial [bacterium]